MSNYKGSTPRIRRFAVTVDGVRHEVVVEELDVDEQPPASPGGASGYTGAPAGMATTDAANNDSLDDGWIVAPMPGTVTEVAVNEGATIAAGDVIVILTAMKLENEITAPAAGVVRAVNVEAGDNVNSGDRLVRLAVEGDGQ